MDAPHVGLRCAAVDVVTEILAKRMEPLPKLNLIQVCTRSRMQLLSLQQQRRANR